MLVRCSIAALAISVSPLVAQNARTGISHPDADIITADQDRVRPTKPSAALPAQSVSSSPELRSEVYGPYTPYRKPSDSAPQSRSETMDVDGQVVTSVEDLPDALREGTLLHTRLDQSLSTETAEPGTSFTAELDQPVLKEGRVILPIGALLHGRVTAVHSGRRISGAALLHLEAKSVTLPDGTQYPIHALLVDTDQAAQTRVDHEGSLVRRDHPKETLAAMGVATGGAAAAGAVLGGGLGAAVGAGIGAGAGTVLWLKQNRQAVVPGHSLLVFSLLTPMPLTPEKQSAHIALPERSYEGVAVGDLPAINR